MPEIRVKSRDQLQLTLLLSHNFLPKEKSASRTVEYLPLKANCNSILGHIRSLVLDSVDMEQPPCKTVFGKTVVASQKAIKSKRF